MSSTVTTATLPLRPLSAGEQTIARPAAGWPLVVEGTGPAAELACRCLKHRAELRARLTERGALLFRGFGVGTTDDFRQVLDALDIDPSPFPYAGNTLRRTTGPDVYAVTDAPSWTSIFPHNEMFYWFRQPRFISLFCQRSDGLHGETPIVDCRQVWAALPADLRRRLRDARFYVTSRYASAARGERNPLSLGTQLANTWQAVGGTSEREVFEAFAVAGGATVVWKRDGAALVTVDNALVIAHPDSGDPVFRGLGLDPLTSVRVHNRHIRDRLSFGRRLRCSVLDAALWFGSKVQRRVGLSAGSLSRADLHEMYDAVWTHSVFFRWRAGDVLVVDNVCMGHGRLDVDGPRTLHVALGGAVEMTDLGPLDANPGDGIGSRR